MITSSYSPQAEKSLVLIAGMPDSGRNTAASVLEEMGRYVADNLLPESIMRTVELSFEMDSPVKRLAIITNMRSHVFAGSSGEVLDELRNEEHQPYVIFLDVNDDTLIARYDSARRTHPLQENGTLSQGVAAERQMPLPMKSMSDLVADIPDMSVHDLCREPEYQLSDTASKTQQITIESFGFKYGAPRDADMPFDARLLPNPYWVPELRAGRGTNKAAVDYVLSQPESRGFLDNVTGLIELVLPGYRREGKGFMTVAVGCTGGHHRSVAMSGALAKKLKGVSGINVDVVHRNIDRDQRLPWRRRN